MQNTFPSLIPSNSYLVNGIVVGLHSLFRYKPNTYYMVCGHGSVLGSRLYECPRRDSSYDSNRNLPPVLFANIELKMIGYRNINTSTSLQ